jgi:hypothetical protein
MTDLTKPLFALYPTAKWTLNGDTYAGLTWLSENIQKPTEQELTSWIDPKAYIAKRQAEYPTIGDQLDALWKGGDAQTEMLAKVMAVKAKYPKVTT